VRGSITSTEIPSCSACSAAASASCTRPDCDHGHVRAYPQRSRALPRGIGSISSGNSSRWFVELDVLEEDDAIVVVDRRPEQSPRVARRRGIDDLQPGHADEPSLRFAARVRSRRPAGAALCAHRQAVPSTVRPTCSAPWRRVDELFHGEREEVLVHDLDDWTHAQHRRANTAPVSAISEIGELRTLPGPNSSSMPSVTFCEPPCSAMSWPMMNHVRVAPHRLRHRVPHGFAVAKPGRRASRIDVLQQRRRVGVGAPAGELDGVGYYKLCFALQFGEALVREKRAARAASRSGPRSRASARTRPCRDTPAGRRRCAGQSR